MKNLLPSLRGAAAGPVGGFPARAPPPYCVLGIISVRDLGFCRQSLLSLVCFCIRFCHCIGRFFHFLQCSSVYPCSYTHKHIHSHTHMSTYTHTRTHTSYVRVHARIYACIYMRRLRGSFDSCRSNLTLLFNKVSYMYNALYFSMHFCFFLHLGSSARMLRAFFNTTITFSG